MNNEMNITSAQYLAWNGSNQSITGTIDSIEMSVPLDTAKRHSAEIMRKIGAGTLTIEDAE